MVSKGSPVRVRQRALTNRATTRFSCFRSGSNDHFRALPSERSSMAADGRCAAVCATADHVLFPAQGTEAVHGRRGVSVTTRPANRRRGVRGSHPRACSRVGGALVSAVASGESMRPRRRRARQVSRAAKWPPRSSVGSTLMSIRTRRRRLGMFSIAATSWSFAADRHAVAAQADGDAGTGGSGVGCVRACDMRGPLGGRLRNGRSIDAARQRVVTPAGDCAAGPPPG